MQNIKTSAGLGDKQWGDVHSGNQNGITIEMPSRYELTASTSPSYVILKDVLTKGQLASCNGNVITLHPDAKPGLNTDLNVAKSLFEHEVQHVVQHYEVEDSDAKYDADPLFYEQEACARQLLKTPVTKEIIESIVDNLVEYGMDSGDALIWLHDVRLSEDYPGVTSPRIQGR